mmetsp:Transcript_71667/g.213898  ORF Transcript_71667/g.213898 Transcript_71667/m.213898 type:complete len:217 (-) Transcript_71667:414-1064(-)
MPTVIPVVPGPAEEEQHDAQGHGAGTGAKAEEEDRGEQPGLPPAGCLSGIDREDHWPCGEWHPHVAHQWRRSLLMVAAEDEVVLVDYALDGQPEVLEVEVKVTVPREEAAQRAVRSVVRVDVPAVRHRPRPDALGQAVVRRPLVVEDRGGDEGGHALHVAAVILAAQLPGLPLRLHKGLADADRARQVPPRDAREALTELMRRFRARSRERPRQQC